MWLRIDFQPGQIGVNWNLGKLAVVVPPAKVTIDNGPAEITIKNHPAVLRIDQETVTSEIGIRKIDSLTKELRTKAMENASRFIDKMVSEGNSMADIHRNRHAIPKLAKPPLEIPEVNFTTIPQHFPDIQVEPIPVLVEVASRQLDVRVEEGRVESDYQRAAVDVYVKQKPFLDISVVKSVVDLYL